MICATFFPPLSHRSGKRGRALSARQQRASPKCMLNQKGWHIASSHTQGNKNKNKETKKEEGEGREGNGNGSEHQGGSALNFLFSFFLSLIFACVCGAFLFLLRTL